MSKPRVITCSTCGLSAERTIRDGVSVIEFDALAFRELCLCEDEPPEFCRCIALRESAELRIAAKAPAPVRQDAKRVKRVKAA